MWKRRRTRSAASRAAIEAWRTTGRGSVGCPACGVAVPVTAWSWGAGFALGCLALDFCERAGPRYTVPALLVRKRRCSSRTSSARPGIGPTVGTPGATSLIGSTATGEGPAPSSASQAAVCAAELA